MYACDLPLYIQMIEHSAGTGELVDGQLRVHIATVVDQQVGRLCRRLIKLSYRQFLGRMLTQESIAEDTLGGGKSQQHVSERTNHTVVSKKVVIMVITFDVPLGVIFGDSVGGTPHAVIGCVKCIAYAGVELFEIIKRFSPRMGRVDRVPVCLVF